MNRREALGYLIVVCHLISQCFPVSIQEFRRSRDDGVRGVKFQPETLTSIYVSGFLELTRAYCRTAFL